MNKTKLYKLAKLVMTFKEVESDKGTLILDGEIAEGVAVDMLVDEEVVAAEDGEYEVDGVKFTVKDGKIESITEPEPETEQEPEQKEELEEQPEEQKEELEEQPEEQKEEQPDEKDTKIAELEAKCAELEAQNAEKDARIAELEAELNKPVEEPIQMKSVVKQAKNMSDKNGALKYFE